MKKGFGIFFSLVSLFLFACRQPPVTGTATPASSQQATPARPAAAAPAAPTPKLEDTPWKVTRVGDKSVEGMNREPSLQFSADHRVSGTGGCNRLMGSYELNGNKIKFGPIAGTKMACLEGKDVDGPLSEALGRVDSFKIEKKNLTLRNEAGATLVELEAK